MLLNFTMLDKGSRHTQLQRPATEEGFKSPYLHVIEEGGLSAAWDSVTAIRHKSII